MERVDATTTLQPQDSSISEGIAKLSAKDEAWIAKYPFTTLSRCHSLYEELVTCETDYSDTLKPLKKKIENASLIDKDENLRSAALLLQRLIKKKTKIIHSPETLKPSSVVSSAFKQLGKYLMADEPDEAKLRTRLAGIWGIHGTFSLGGKTQPYDQGLLIRTTWSDGSLASLFGNYIPKDLAKKAFPFSMPAHVAGVLFSDDLVIIANRAFIENQLGGMPGLVVHRIKDKDPRTIEAVKNTIMNSAFLKEEPEKLFEENIKDMLGMELIGWIPRNYQYSGNCWWVNFTATFLAGLYVEKFHSFLKEGHDEKKAHQLAMDEALPVYKEAVAFARETALKNYLKTSKNPDQALLAKIEEMKKEKSANPGNNI